MSRFAPRRPAPWLLIACAILGMVGCKAYLNPSVPPEGDAELAVAQAEAELRQKLEKPRVVDTTNQQITLTLNNAPGPDQPLEMELMQRLVDLFERRNPGIRVQFSPWRFTAESFLERLGNRTLTDVVEVDSAQLPIVLELNCAADLTENVATSPEIRAFNPASLTLGVRQGRFYAVPGELHTLALFYNRRLLASKITQPVETPTPAAETPKPERSSRRRSRGGDDDPEADLSPKVLSLMEEAALAAAAPPRVAFQVAQTDEPAPQAPPRRSRRSRAEQEVGEYYNVQQAEPQQQQERRRGVGGFFRSLFRREDDAPQPEATPAPRRTPKTRPVPTSTDTGDATTTGATTDTPRTDPNNPDILPTDPNEAADTKLIDRPTTVIETIGLPETWDQFIQRAGLLTDHAQGIYGFAPVLFARDGGREFCQWGIQSGLQIQIGTSVQDISMDVNSATAASVIQFLKDLRWRYDVAPPPEQCFRDNLMKLFAQGKLAMMVLPADRATISQLLKLGLPLDDLGIAALPGGPRNRKHLVFGKFSIVNSQLDAQHRAAAFKWLMFLNDPETVLIREQYYHLEGELTGAPSVARFSAGRQNPLRETLRHFSRLPFFADYDRVMGDSAPLALEPPHGTDRFYESLIEDIRPMIEQKASNPATEVAKVGQDFLKKLTAPPTQSQQGIRQVIRSIPGLLGTRPDNATPTPAQN